jgi:hypothetical protein
MAGADDLKWVRWNAPVAERHPEIHAAIGKFDAGDRPAARAAADWLQSAGLSGESTPYLAISAEGQVLGFYAWTAGSVELSSAHRKKLGVRFPTQGAILVTQLAKSVHHDFAGWRLLQDAIGIAQETSKKVGATVLALDPFDADTGAMWEVRFKMRRSRTEVQTRGEGEPLKRLYLPLRDPRD